MTLIPAPEVDEVYSASTFTVVLRPDEVYGQGQTHSNWNTSDPDKMDLKWICTYQTMKILNALWWSLRMVVDGVVATKQALERRVLQLLC